MQIFKHRGLIDLLELKDDIIEQIETSEIMKELWGRYLSKNPYIDNIDFNEVCYMVKDFANRLN